MPALTPTKKRKNLLTFERWLVENDRSPLSVKNYLADIRRFGEWFRQTSRQALAPELITPQDVRDYRDYLFKHKAASSTINRRLTSLRLYARWAKEAGLIEFDPAERVRSAERQVVAPKWLDRSDTNALVREARNQIKLASEAKKGQAIRNHAVIVILLNTGLRVSELCALEMGDLTYSERKGKIKVRRGKGSKQREVPLNPEALEALKAVLDARPESLKHRFVFAGQDGLPLKPGGVQEMLAALSRRAGAEATPHTLRHTFAKNLVDRGVPLDQVAALLGHSSLNTTRLYTTPSEADLERAVSAIGE